MFLLNPEHIVSITVSPLKENTSYTIVPAHTVTTWFWLWKKTTEIPESVRSVWFSYDIPIDQFQESYKEQMIIDGKVYDKPFIAVYMVNQDYRKKYYDNEELQMKRDIESLSAHLTLITF